LNKAAVKTFAISARKKLIGQVGQKAMQIGLAAEKGYDQVIEEVAYIWFSRFIALRFLEVNDYLPARVRVLSSRDPDNSEPDIIREALNINLAAEWGVIRDFQENNDSEGLYKYLLFCQCKELNKILPFMFEECSDYTELLFPGNLLQEGSIIKELVSSIAEEDWKEPEIIGWLYQYYISGKKDEVFADLKKNKKITKEDIPAATQLFTPKWIVQYMLQNSLGRLWLASHSDPELKARWVYYIEEAEQEPEVEKQLQELKNPNLCPLDIKVLDPCCGSGHILVYAFDLLYEIYQSYGYPESDICELILKNNIYGLDIDDRVVKMASFALLMKARSKNREVFNEQIKLNICAIQESNWLDRETREILVNSEAPEIEQRRQQDIIKYLADTFWDAREYGSILNVKQMELEFLEQKPDRGKDLKKLPGLIQQARIMSGKYEVVCTNPPYMGNRGMNSRLSDFIKSNYQDSKTDFFAVFMEKCRGFLKNNGYYSLITQPSWLFLHTYQKLREKITRNDTIYSLLHMGRGIFGIDFGSVSFVARKCCLKNYSGEYFRLHHRVFQYIDSEDIKNILLNSIANPDYSYNFSQYQNTGIEQLNEEKAQSDGGYDADLKIRFRFSPQNSGHIHGSPHAYWVSTRMQEIFKEGIPLEEIAAIRQGMATADNKRFLRLWHEVDINKAGFGYSHRNEASESKRKWFPYNKGGDYRKWYGNNNYLVNWENDGKEIKNLKDGKGKIRSRPQNLDFFYRESITWSFVSSTRFGVRYSPRGYIFDVGGSSVFPPLKDIYLLTALLCSNVAYEFLKIQNPTLNFQVGNIGKLPIIIKRQEDIMQKINSLSQENIRIAKLDWDAFETSWDFKTHPLLKCKKEGFTLEKAFAVWSDHAETQFKLLKANEEELNRIFIEIYGLEDEITPKVKEKDITVRKPDRERDLKSFISYAVGCMFGRYSLDEDGLVFAGGQFDPERYKTFAADTDGIIPLLNKAGFQNDIADKFVEFVKITFGEVDLRTNLDYIANTLGIKSKETAEESIRRYFLKKFYYDHVRMYQKRPIYWLFTSGKKQGFNALVYLHRYNDSTLAQLQTAYLYPLQNRLKIECLRLNKQLLLQQTASEKKKTSKRLEELREHIEELKQYEENICDAADQQIRINLDDGIMNNYVKLQAVLANI
jgi:type II restriction/modification system DNA methylase subunit YeeA